MYQALSIENTGETLTWIDAFGWTKPYVEWLARRFYNVRIVTVTHKHAGIKILPANLHDEWLSEEIIDGLIDFGACCDCGHGETVDGLFCKQCLEGKMYEELGLDGRVSSV